MIHQPSIRPRVAPPPRATIIAQVVEAAGARLGLADDDIEDAICVALSIVAADDRIEGLTAQQTKLVNIIAAARGRVVTKAELYDALNTTSEPKIVDVVLCHARKRRPDLGRYLETAWGAGVRWVGPKLTREMRREPAAEAAE